MIMKKTAKKAQAKLNAKFTALVSAAAIGFNLCDRLRGCS
jgi:hypothetical protein